MFAFTAPPTFLETPPAFVEVRDREALSLTCTAIGNPQPVVIWKRSDLAVQSGDAVQVSTAMLSVPLGGDFGVGGRVSGGTATLSTWLESEPWPRGHGPESLGGHR